MIPYKVKILNGVLKLKTFAENILNVLGIKDLGTQTGQVTNGYVDWSIQHLTKTTAQWSGDTTTILLKGQLGVEDTENTAFKLKIGNGTDIWNDLQYLSGDKNYIHIQNVSSNSWVVNHNLNKRCNVQILNNSYEEIIGDIKWIDNNTVNIYFNTNIIGFVYCN